MATTSPVTIIAGFSLTNRLLLYANLITAPAAFMSGLGTSIPINAGFLGYTIYQQYLFYVATKHKQLHALSMLPAHLNIMYALTYLGGLSAGNYFLTSALLMGTAAVLILNNITNWTSYLTNLPEGYSVYRFFFFGWRTLSHNWSILFLLWAVGDSIATFIYVVIGAYVGTCAVELSQDMEEGNTFRSWNDTSLLWGSVLGLAFCWPLILWTEMIVQGNHIVSETDWISIYLFIAQISLLVIPIIYRLSCSFWRRGGGGATGRRRQSFIPLSLFTSSRSQGGSRDVDAEGGDTVIL
ncbi:hypothetical protein D9619_005190 [Psilocybe cf. subviscida]|uniref:Uncharacterized protein n=1 Tax=Psilocybe cf. subviscida TaxID=2480587 RepID=A0A8H5FBB1_9AGAR|nr:hypothetical protein D9619_005190 [Psilocybe cf. subviscida]